MHSIGEREAAITHITESEEGIAALRAHVQEIVEGGAFKGSSRCARFLTYIVDQAIAGHFESLKERVIGLELFDRSPAYDTSEDAIVRVTASDVRKRLLQHYGKYGGTSEFRVNLPLGSYIPEIIYEHKTKTSQSVSGKSHLDSATVTRTPSAHSETEIAEIPGPRTSEPGTVLSKHRSRRRWLIFAVVLAGLNLAVWGFMWRRLPRSEAAAGTPAPTAVLPWSALFSSLRPTHLVTSDPDIGAIQILTRSPISVSDYANRRYLPEHNTLSAELKDVCINLLAGDKASNVDAEIAAEVAELARSYSRNIDVQGARSLQFSNLKTDDNFIFLGSPSSNPWFSIFDDQLGFRFVSAQVPGEASFAIFILLRRRKHRMFPLQEAERPGNHLLWSRLSAIPSRVDRLCFWQD